MFNGILKKQDDAVYKDGVIILYGTKTGNAKVIAKELKKQLKKIDLNPVSINMKKADASILEKVSKAFFIVSTHGDGEPPAAAKKFFKQLHSNKMRTLNHLDFSVCGLGDSSYDLFCEASKTLNKQLIKLGANAIIKRAECDADFGKTAAKWIKKIKNQFESSSEPVIEDENISFKTNDENLYEGKLVTCERLSKTENGNYTYHIELSNFNKPISFYPGDLIEIVPSNPLWLVNEIAQKLNTAEFNDALINNKEICRLSPLTVKAYAWLTNNKDVDALIIDKDRLKAFVDRANFLDLITDYPTDCSAKDIINILPNLTGRQYSIANYPTKSNDSLHLMIKTVRFDYRERKHEGAASVYTNEFLKLGESIQFKYIKSKEYYLPQDISTPLILIGAGTGYAPLRGYLQQWYMQKPSSKAWVIWGEQKHKLSNKYNIELKRLQKKTKLLHVDCVSSRDKEAKAYVQDKIMSNPKQFMKLIKKGASIYVCGSKEMGNDVENTIAQILKSSNISIDALKETNRYITSVY